MAVINTNISCDLQSAVQVQYINGNMFSQDIQANTINVSVTDGGEPATISGTVTANIVRADGGTVTATGGTISGNVASITLPAAAYAVPGLVSIIVKLTDSGVVTTLAAVVANVYQSSTETAIDPGTIIPSVTALVSQIETAVASIPADYSSLWTSLAPAFSTSATYAPGQYVTYDGALYVCTTAHTGSWVAGHFAATNLGAGLSDLKSAITSVNNNYLPSGIVWEQGTINNSGEEESNSYYVRSDYINLGNKTLFINPGSTYRITVFFYNSSKTFLSKTSDLNRANAYQMPENGSYVRLKVRKEPIASVTPATIGSVPVYYSIENNKSYVPGEISNSTERLTEIDGLYYTPTELGYAANTTGTPAYDDNNTNSVRIIRGLEPTLNIGDVVGLSSYTGYKMQVYYLHPNNTAGYTGWITKDWVCTENSKHWVMIRKSDETAITDPDAVGNLLFVKKADYAVIESAGNVLPSYWLDHLKTKEQTINTIDGTVGEDGCSFIFWTDMHWPANYGNSPALIRHILKHTGVRDVVCGGDILGGSYADVATAYSALCDFRNIISARDFPMLTLRGNHDLTPDGSMYLSDNQFYGAMLKPYERYATLIRKTYYYRDDETLKLRYYYLDSRAVSSDSLDADQLTWLGESLTEIPSDWQIIVFVHAVHTPAASSSSATLEPSYPAYQIATVFGTADKKSQLIAMIGGHTHRDEITTNYGCLLISVTTDAGGTTASDWDANYPTRTPGTVTEQAFDVFHINIQDKTIYMTRIGAGEDRYLTYGS